MAMRITGIAAATASASASASASRIATPKKNPQVPFSLPHLNFHNNLASPPKLGKKISSIVSIISYQPLMDCVSGFYTLSNGIRNHPHEGFQWQIRATISEAGLEPASSKKQGGDQSIKDWKIKMLYDGDCPLCMREVNMLRERNKSYGTIKFVDISSDDYSPQENQGLDYETVMGRIHAILSDGTVVTDVEAFWRLYENVGLGWVYAITKYEPIAKIADSIYGVWAKYRLQITGRPPMEEILEARKKKGEICKDSNACKM